jgi:hypothetical protein
LSKGEGRRKSGEESDRSSSLVLSLYDVKPLVALAGIKLTH